MLSLARYVFALLIGLFAMEQVGRYKPGENLTGYGKKTVHAGRFVKLVGRTAAGAPEIEEAGDKEKAPAVLGVAQREVLESAPASSVDRLTEVMCTGGVARVLAGEEIKVGEQVRSGAEGKAKKSEAKEEQTLGVALSTAKESEYVEVQLRL